MKTETKAEIEIEIDKILKSDLCRSCAHMNTCRYYEKLSSAVNPIPELKTSFDVLITAGIALNDEYISPFSEEVILRNLPSAPAVGIIHCNDFKERKSPNV